MAASVPQLDDHLPELLEFARTMARQIEAGELHDGDALAQHFRDFYTTDQMRAIEVIAPGWQDMAAFADGATLNHITEALIALQLLPEYRQASHPTVRDTSRTTEPCRRSCKASITCSVLDRTLRSSCRRYCCTSR